MSLMIIAMDRASVRRIDAQGFLHVETSPISKEQIRVYAGSEIPGWQRLGLDAGKSYRMFCPGDELAKGAASANGVPLLHTHQPVDCDNIPDELIVGSIGSRAAFDGTYLNNSLAVWKRADIRKIQQKRKYQLSGGYQYTPVMQPGEFQGVAFDGRMTDIRFNHVAIVFEGRAGPDVVIGDENMLKSRAALLASGALMGLIAPKLDSSKGTLALDVAMDGITAATFADETQTKAFAETIVGLTDGKLAQDAALTVDDVIGVIGMISFDASNDDLTPKIVNESGGTVTTDAVTGVITIKPAAIGMDEAGVAKQIETAVANARATITADAAALRTAEREVQPIIGAVSCDSAPAAYKLALDHYKVDLTGVAEDGYGALFRATKAARDVKKPIITGDSKSDPLKTIVPDLPALVRI